MLAVRLTPKSGRDEIVGVEAFGDETVLKARVRAVPKPAAPMRRSRS